MKKTVDTALDLEWIELIVVAKRIGLTIQEIREFLNKESDRRDDEHTAL